MCVSPGALGRTSWGNPLRSPFSVFLLVWALWACAGTSLSALNVGSADQMYEISKLTDHIAITSLNQYVFMLAYRVRGGAACAGGACAPDRARACEEACVCMWWTPGCG